MRNAIFLLIAALVVPTLAHALPSHTSLRDKLNRNVVTSDGQRFRLGDQLTNKKPQVMAVVFDSAVNGQTAVGVHYLKDVDGSSAVIPSGAIVKQAYIDVTTSITATSAAPVLGFYVETPGDIKGGVTTTWYRQGYSHILPVDGTTVFKTTADRGVNATITGGALTGGTMTLFIEYLLPR